MPSKLIKTGEVIELGHVLSDKMPFFGTRRFDMHIKRTFLNQFSNMRGSNEEIVISEIGQVGTQLDGFAHQTHLNSWYNCFKVDENATRSGFTKLGIHNVGALITRGVLIDVAGFKGVEMLGDNYEVTVEDIEGALKKQNMTLQPGDAVIINTGWGKLWGKDNARYVKSCPGIGVKAAEWLVAKDPMLIGSDNWPVEVAPNPDKQVSLPVHQIALVVNGIHLLENLEARRAGGERGLRVRLHDAAAEDPGRQRLDRDADRGALIASVLPGLQGAARGRSRREPARARTACATTWVVPVVAQFLENRRVQDLLKPCESATGKGSIKNAMIECQSNNHVAVRIGWPVAQQARLRRSRCAEVGPPPRGRRHAVGSQLPAQPWNVHAHAEDQAASQQWKPSNADQLAMQACFLERGGSGIPYHVAQLLHRHAVGLVETQRQQTEVAQDPALVHDANGTVDVLVEVRPRQSEVDAA